MSEAFFTAAFTLWGSPVTWLEIVAFGLALAMVGCNIREIHWGWPLAMASSLLYFALFWRSRLYGEAALQVFFAGVAGWGWYQWLRGHGGDSTARPCAWPVCRCRAWCARWPPACCCGP